MYRRKTGGWLKHSDFILLDIICLNVGFVLAYWIRSGLASPYVNADYRSFILFLTFLDFLIILLSDNMAHIVTRGLWMEFKDCLRNAVVMLVAATLYLFTLKMGEAYSRIVVYLTCGIYFLLNYTARVIWKRYIRRTNSRRRKDAMLVAAKKDKMHLILKTLEDNSFNLPIIRGLIVLDGEENMGGYNFPAVANFETMTEYITHNWVDELLIDSGDPADGAEYLRLQEEIGKIADSGVAVHKILWPEKEADGRMRLVENIGGFSVLTESIRIASLRQVLFKRCLDIVGGLVGSVIAVVILIVVGPVIYIQSPGPVIFKQKRVGRNGKIFTMYKIRSMCLDAEARKKELVAANRVSDNMMFKLDFDPRIIGAKQMPDGTVRRGIGNFIRDYSLDETPNFFNVLKGDMSLVGTRPPTLDEWERYSPYHRARMTFKPGVTGLWQISGRSDITDFDEVIRLDMKYINEWNTGTDFRIMLETVKKVLKKDGAR